MKKMSTQKKILWFLCFFLGFVAIAVIGFLVVYFLKNYIVTKPPVMQTTPGKVATFSAGFKEYEISNNATFNYPENFKVTESSYGLGTKTVTFSSPDTVASEAAFTFQAFSVRKNLAKMAGQDFDKFYDMKDGQSQLIKSPIDDKKETFTKVSNRTFSGLKAIEYKSSPDPKPKEYIPEIGVIIDAEGTLILFSAGEENRSEFEKVLRTFTYNR